MIQGALIPEDRADMLQAPRELNSRGRQRSPARNPGNNLQPNNPGIGFPASQPGFLGSQTQVARIQAMMQMQALQQQQNQIWMAGLLQNTGLYAPFLSTPSAGPFTPGITSLQAVPSPPSALLEATVHTTTFMRDDEDTFARALYTNGENVGATLNSLDGVNGHSKSQWGGYFLKNSEKIQQKAKLLEIGRPKKTSTPSARPSKNYSRPSRPSDLGDTPRQTRAKTRRSGQYASSHSFTERTRSRRAYNRSPSPTPPTNVISTPQGGHKYTNGDVAFFKTFLAHTLKYEPDALDTRSAFSKELAERVPHHSVLSWQSWMRDNEDIVQRVVRKVEGEDTSSDSEPDDDSQDDDPDESDAPSGVEKHDASPSLGASANEVDSHLDVPAKKPRIKVAYLPEDWQALSRHIATVSLAQWDKEKDWIAFQKIHTRHSVTQWMHWYARHKEGIIQMAQCFEICNALQEEEAGRSITVTRGSNRPSQIPMRPTPSSSRSQRSASTHPVQGKRNHEDDDDSLEMHLQFAKRCKKPTAGSWVC